MFWTCTALALFTLAPAEAGELSLTNVRLTHGMHGPVRGSDKVYPGDIVFVSFDIEGITIDNEGKVRYSMATSVTDDKGKVLFKQDPRKVEVPVSLGGNRVPAYVKIDCGLQQPAGDYSVKVVVTDLATDKSQTLTRAFQVVPRGFALVRLALTSDPEAFSPVVAAGSGEVLWVHFGAVDFARDRSTKQPNVTVSLRIVDENGRPTRAKPMTAQVNKDVPEAAQLLPLQFLLSLNRPGKFVAELSATDQISGKTAKLTFPLKVQGPE